MKNPLEFSGNINKMLMYYILLYSIIAILTAFLCPLVFSVIISVIAIVIVLQPLIAFFTKLFGFCDSKSSKKTSVMIANALAIFIFFASILVLLIFLIPSIVKEAGSFLSFFENFFAKKEWEQLSVFKENPDLSTNINDLLVNIQPKIALYIEGMLTNLSKSTPQVLSFVFYLFLGTLYLVYYFPGFKNKMRYMFPEVIRSEANDFMRELYHQLKRYLFSIFVVAVIVGLMMGTVLSFLGSNYSILLGFWAAFTNLIPIVGVILEFIPLLLLSTSLGINGSIMLLLAILAIHTFAFIMFLNLMRGYMKINPVAIIFLILFFSQVFGFIGSLIAVPVGIFIRIFYERFIRFFFEKKYEIKKTGVQMLIALYGDDLLFKELRVKKELKEGNQRFLPINSDKKKELEEQFPLLFTNNMFGESYVVYFKKFDSLSKAVKKTYLAKLDIFREVHCHKIFLDVEEKFKDDSLKQEMFELPKPWKREEWELKVRQVSGLYGLRLKKHQIEKLLDISDNDLMFIKNEIEKMSVIAENYVVDDELFNSLLFSNAIENTDEFVYDFLSGNYPKAISTYSILLENMAAQQIMYQLYKNSVILYELMKKIPAKERYSFDEMKNYSKITGYNIPTISKFTGFAFKQSERKPCILREMDLETAEELLIKLWEIDFGLKNGVVAPSSALIILISDWRKN